MCVYKAFFHKRSSQKYIKFNVGSEVKIYIFIWKRDRFFLTFLWTSENSRETRKSLKTLNFPKYLVKKSTYFVNPGQRMILLVWNERYWLKFVYINTLFCFWFMHIAYLVRACFLPLYFSTRTIILNYCFMDGSLIAWRSSNTFIVK